MGDGEHPGWANYLAAGSDSTRDIERAMRGMRDSLPARTSTGISHLSSFIVDSSSFLSYLKAGKFVIELKLKLLFIYLYL